MTKTKKSDNFISGFFEVKEDGIEEDFSEGLNRLVARVNDTDSSHYGCPLDADGYAYFFSDKDENGKAACIENMVSVLAFYYMGDKYKGQDIVEVSAFTHPLYRKKGLFKRELFLLQKFLLEKGSSFVIRFAVYDDENTIKVLHSLGAIFDHEEMIMTKDLYETKSLETEEELSFEDGCFRTKFSECYALTYNDEAYIYGVLTYDRFLRKGHAEKLLEMVSDRLFSEGIRSMRLEVSGENIAALRLYEKMGFIKTDGLYYYYLDKEW